MDITSVAVSLSFCVVILVREWFAFRLKAREQAYWLALVEKREKAAEDSLELARKAQAQAHATIIGMKMPKGATLGPELVQRLAHLENFLQTSRGSSSHPREDIQPLGPPNSVIGRMKVKQGGKSVRVRRAR